MFTEIDLDCGSATAVAFIAEDYAAQRKRGERAKHALHSARILSEAEAAQDEGNLAFVLLYWDDSVTEEDLFGDCVPPHMLPKLRAQVERNGVFGIGGAWRLGEDEQWTLADSVFGFFGDDDDDPNANPYGPDVLASALDALKKAREERMLSAVRNVWGAER
jgi:hypothetical protein